MNISGFFAVLVLTLALIAPASAARRQVQTDCASAAPDRSIAACTRIIKARAEPARELAAAHLHRGDAWQAKGDYDRAIADYDEALRLNPKYTSAYVNRGNAWQAKGKYDQAIADENEAIKLYPDLKGAYVDRGNAWQSEGKYAQAIADDDAALRIEPNDAIAYFNRGNAYRSEAKYIKAVEDFNEAIKLAPKFYAAYFYRGIANVYADALPKALADFNQANTLDPKNAYAALWIDIVDKRSNVPSRLPELATHLDMTQWPAPVVRLFLHQLTPKAVLAAAADPNAEKQKAQQCEANFYSGELALQQGTKDEAARLFGIAAKDCPQTFNEWFAANAELKALGKS